MSYENETTLVLGHRGSGKTRWLSKNIESYKPFVLVDPLYDPSYKALKLHTIKSMDEAFKLFRDGKPERIYVSPDLVHFDYICGIVLATGDMTLIVDEVDQYQTSHYIPPNFKKILKIGRHHGINIIMIARRPKEINPLLRSQASRFIIFPLGGEDTRELSEHIGKHAYLINDLKTNPGVDSDYLDYNFSKRESTIKNLIY
jgi:hypothetical protein